MIPPNPINANTYLPGVQVIPGDLLITAITQAYPMAVTFINNSGNTYIAGQNVRLVIPTIYGMQQANGLIGTILTVDDMNYILYLNIDSTNFDPFWYPGTYVYSNLPQDVLLYFGTGYLLGAIGLPKSASIVPGSLYFGYADNHYTDPGANGILVGSPNGTGTVNYSNGYVQVSIVRSGLYPSTVFTLSYVINFGITASSCAGVPTSAPWG